MIPILEGGKLLNTVLVMHLVMGASDVLKDNCSLAKRLEYFTLVKLTWYLKISVKIVRCFGHLCILWYVPYI